jgi:hypothetical protein
VRSFAVRAVAEFGCAGEEVVSNGWLAAVAAIGVRADQAGEEEVFLGDAGAV